MIECIELQIARSKILAYEQDADDAIVHASRQAQDCLDCEEFLAKGIAALGWVERCEGALNEATCEGVMEMTQSIEEAIEVLYESWLRPCTFAEKWIAICQGNGYEVKNLAEFRGSCERVQDWLERNAIYKQARAARNARFAEEPW